MRPREGGRTNLFQTDRRAKITPHRMPNCLVPKIGWRETKRSQVFPSLFENATLIEDLRRKWSFQFDKARLRRPPLPYCTRLGSGLISISQSQIPSQQNCWERESAHELFKGYSYGPFARARMQPVKCRLKLRMEMANHSYFTGRQLALLQVAHDNNCGEKAPDIPEE